MTVRLEAMYLSARRFQAPFEFVPFELRILKVVEKVFRKNPLAQPAP